jgi:hypothetical protein
VFKKKSAAVADLIAKAHNNDLAELELNLSHEGHGLRKREQLSTKLITS